jgi:hypothetical protein
MSGRDKDATWHWLDDARREPGWPRGRILDEIKARRLPWRGYVSGMGFVTSDAFYAFYPDGSIEKVTADWDGNELIIVVLDNQFHPHTVEGVEVLLPTDASRASSAPPAEAPSAPSAPFAPSRNKVSNADMRDCLLAIIKDHADGKLIVRDAVIPRGSPPLDEETLQKEMEHRLDARLERDRVRELRDNHAPHFKLPVGRPRKSTQ